MIDFAQAFRDGCREAPLAVADRTDVEDAVRAMCVEASKEAARVYQLPDARGAALAFVMFTHSEERALFAPTCNIPEGQARVYLMHGEWERVKDIPAKHGVELLSFRRGPSGYPARVTSFNGVDQLCANRGQLDAALANILRDPSTGARIRKVARDFINRPTFDQ